MHVTAARRLLNRYKGPGSKSAILACVNRKAKSLGCDKGKDKEFTGGNFDELYTAEEARLADEMLKTDEWAGTIEMLDSQETDFVAIDQARALLVNMLADARKLSDEQREQLKSRSLQSLTDAMNDLREELAQS